jgi:hypothetical protein
MLYIRAEIRRTDGVCHKNTVSDRPWYVTGPAAASLSARPCSVATESLGRLTGSATVTVTVRPRSVATGRSGRQTGHVTATFFVRPCSVL